MKRGGGGRRHDQTAIRGTREGRDGVLDLTDVAQVDGAYLHPERWRRGLDRGKHAGSGTLSGIPKDRHSRHAWRNLLEQLQPFPADAVFGTHETSSVAARPPQAVDKARSDRIDRDWEHNRDGSSRLQQWQHGQGPMGQNDVWRERDQFRRVFANFGGIDPGPAGIDPDVAAD